MSKRSYPRKVWVLQPSFKPVEITVVGQYASWSRDDYGDTSDKGKTYPVDSMHKTLDLAVAHGRLECERIRADIEKRTENLSKKIAALDKAAGGAK